MNAVSKKLGEKERIRIRIFFFLEHAGELRIIVLIEEKGVIHRPKHTQHTPLALRY